MDRVEDLKLGRIADARLADDRQQIDQVVAAALTCWGHVSRKLLLSELSERTDHITAIAGALDAWPPDAPRIVLATAVWREKASQPPSARHPAAGDARVLEGHAAATHVGAEAAGLSDEAGTS